MPNVSDSYRRQAPFHRAVTRVQSFGDTSKTGETLPHVAALATRQRCEFDKCSIKLFEGVF